MTVSISIFDISYFSLGLLIDDCLLNFVSYWQITFIFKYNSFKMIHKLYYIQKLPFFPYVYVTIKITFCSNFQRIILTCSLINKFIIFLKFEFFLINRCFLILKVEYIILKKFLNFCNIFTCAFILFLIACIYGYVNIFKRCIKPIIIKPNTAFIFKTKSISIIIHSLLSQKFDHIIISALF